jgi:hypothetical protein
MTVAEREYAMTHLGGGDWLCPSNDLAWLYRFTRYEEDGSAYNDDGPVTGQFWIVRRIPMPCEADPFDPDDDDYMWEERAHMLRYRRDGVEVMMRDTIASR